MTNQPMNEAHAREIVAKYTGKVWGGFGSEPPHELIRAEGYIAGLGAGRKENDLIRALASEVMRLLSVHGAQIVSHLLDNDENPGERLRRALDGKL